MGIDPCLIGRNVKTYRLYHHLTQTELAKAVGVKARYISRIENGKAAPTLPVLCRLADALSASLYVLLTVPCDPCIVMLDALWKDATLTQKRLCISLCRTLLATQKASLHQSNALELRK